MKGEKGMKKIHLVTVIVITTIIVNLFSVYSLDNIVSATTIPLVDTTPNSHKLEYVQASGSSSLTITTSTAQEIIYATFYSVNTGYALGISSEPSLTWHNRGGGSTASDRGQIAVWWAVSNVAQPVQITFTSSQTSKKDYVMAAFCVIGADTNAPFDPNLSSAIFNQANSASASASITTTNPNDLVIGVLGIINNKAITAGEGYTLIDKQSTTASGANEHLTASTAGTYTPTFALGSAAWVVIADAFQGNKTLTVLPEYSLGGLTAFVVSLAAMLLFFNRKKSHSKS
jgi:hypothetical protein